MKGGFLFYQLNSTKINIVDAGISFWTLLTPLTHSFGMNTSLELELTCKGTRIGMMSSRVHSYT